MVATGTEKEQGEAAGGEAKALKQNHFVLCRHASREAALDKERDFVAG